VTQALRIIPMTKSQTRRSRVKENKMDNVFNRHRGFCLNIINMVIPQNTYPSQARDLLADMQSLAFLVALSATVSWESLVTAWSGASESSLSGMRVHVTIPSKIRREAIAAHLALANSGI